MSKKYLGENAAAYLVTLLRAALGSKAEATDPRFTDERTPTAHAAVHGAAGAACVPTPSQSGSGLRRRPSSSRKRSSPPGRARSWQSASPARAPGIC